MLQTLINAFKVKDIRAKVWKMLLLLLIFRIGCYIPIPGLDSSVFSENVTGNDFLTLMNSITGGSLANGTLFALGIGPYINAERKVPVQYAKQIKGRKMYGGQSSVIPIRISGSGVMPLIFAFSILSFPQMISGLFWPNGGFYKWWTKWMTGSSAIAGGRILYSFVLCLLIFAFSFFYAQMQFNPEDVSKSIQQNGGFIQGIRPGKATENYLKKISNRITLFGAIYLSLVAFIPALAFAWADPTGTLVNVFSTTGILIVVSVAMEFEKQLQAQMMMKNYKGFLK